MNYNNDIDVRNVSDDRVPVWRFNLEIQFEDRVHIMDCQKYYTILQCLAKNWTFGGFAL